MNKGPDEAKLSDLLYDHLDGKKRTLVRLHCKYWRWCQLYIFISRLLAHPSLVIKSDDSRLTFPRGELLLIGGDLAYVGHF
jgi:hypothetical protein